VFDRYSILEILAGNVYFVNLFRTILPVVPTECDVLIVRRQHNDNEWKFKEQHSKMWEILRGRKDTLAPVVSTLRGRAPRDGRGSIFLHPTQPNPSTYGPNPTHDANTRTQPNLPITQMQTPTHIFTCPLFDNYVSSKIKGRECLYL